jgi:hypothetical protein
MSSSYQKNPQSQRTEVRALLEAERIEVSQSLDTQGGRLHELDPAQYGGRQALVFESKDDGVTLAIRIEVPAASPLREEALTSTVALTFLGALTLALQGHKAEAKLISGGLGLEAVLVSRRLGDRELDAAGVGRLLQALQTLAQQVEPALAASGQDVVARILARVRPVKSDLTKQSLAAEPVIVPTFDQEARDRMMRRASP